MAAHHITENLSLWLFLKWPELSNEPPHDMCEHLLFIHLVNLLQLNLLHLNQLLCPHWLKPSRYFEVDEVFISERRFHLRMPRAFKRAIKHLKVRNKNFIFFSTEGTEEKCEKRKRELCACLWNFWPSPIN